MECEFSYGSAKSPLTESSAEQIYPMTDDFPLHRYGWELFLRESGIGETNYVNWVEVYFCLAGWVYVALQCLSIYPNEQVLNNGNMGTSRAGVSRIY